MPDRLKMIEVFSGDIHCVRDAVIRGDRSIINNLEKATKISNDNMKKMVEWSTEAGSLWDWQGRRPEDSLWSAFSSKDECRRKAVTRQKGN